MKRLIALKQKRAQARAAIVAIAKAAETADRAFNDDERAKIAAHETEIAAFDTEIAELERVAKHEREAAVAVADPAVEEERAARERAQRGSRATDVHNREEDRPFANLGEQLAAIAQSATPGAEIDPRLFAGPSGASATVGADGGFMIRPEFSKTLFDKGFEASQLAPLCDTVTVGDGADGLEVPMIEETSRATGSRFGGVRVYRRAEADTVAGSKVKLRVWELRLEDLMGIAYATERLLQDWSSLGQVFSQQFEREFGFVVDDEIFRGTGVGQCLGITNSDAFISVAAEGGQAADTIVTKNITKSWAQVAPPCRRRAVALYNQELEPQLLELVIGVDASARPVFVPAGDGRQNGTIFGKPAIALEQASAPGDVGDFGWYDLSQYQIIRKAGLSADESIHVRYLYGERTFRWMMRVNGQPKWETAVSPYKGANKVAPFVGIAAR